MRDRPRVIYMLLFADSMVARHIFGVNKVPYRD